MSGGLQDERILLLQFKDDIAAHHESREHRIIIEPLLVFLEPVRTPCAFKVHANHVRCRFARIFDKCEGTDLGPRYVIRFTDMNGIAWTREDVGERNGAFELRPENKSSNLIWEWKSAAGGDSLLDFERAENCEAKN